MYQSLRKCSGTIRKCVDVSRQIERYRATPVRADLPCYQKLSIQNWCSGTRSGAKTTPRSGTACKSVVFRQPYISHRSAAHGSSRSQDEARKIASRRCQKVGNCSLTRVYYRNAERNTNRNVHRNIALEVDEKGRGGHRLRTGTRSGTDSGSWSGTFDVDTRLRAPFRSAAWNRRHLAPRIAEGVAPPEDSTEAARPQGSMRISGNTLPPSTPWSRALRI